MDGPEVLVRKSVPRKFSSLDALFRMVNAFVAEHGLADGVGNDLAIILEELFTNQVRHAEGGGEELSVELAIEQGRLRLEIVDRGVEPFDPTKLPEVDVDRPVEERKPGGLGVHFVRSLSDSFEWSYDPARRESRILVTRLLEK